MPEEATQTAPPAEADSAPSAPAPAEGDGEQPDGSQWLRETAQGLIYSRPLNTGERSREWDAANAELRRGRRDGAAREGRQEEAPPAEEGGDAQPAAEPKPEPRPSAEKDDAEFQRRVQAEVDRREATRTARAEAQRERQLRQSNPTEYAKLKEQQETQGQAAEAFGNALRTLATQFDQSAINPMLDALDEKARGEVLNEPGHGFDGRKTIVTRAIKAIQKAAYDDGFAKGKESAQKTLRRSTAFRKELLSELRGEDEEPELAPANGSPAGGDWDMNDWMRVQTGRRGR
jgi:hypothetical protein